MARGDPPGLIHGLVADYTWLTDIPGLERWQHAIKAAGLLYVLVAPIPRCEIGKA